MTILDDVTERVASIAWQPTATFGAAAECCRLYRLAPPQIAPALAIARPARELAA